MNMVIMVKKSMCMCTQQGTIALVMHVMGYYCEHCSDGVPLQWVSSENALNSLKGLLEECEVRPLARGRRSGCWWSTVIGQIASTSHTNKSQH